MRARVHLALAVVAVLFSLNYIIGKIALRHFEPFAFAWLRVAGSALCLTLFTFSRGESRLTPPPGYAMKMIIFSLLGVVVNQLLFITGLSLTTAHEAAILITTIPVFTLGAAIALGRENPTFRRIFGIALAAAGALFLVGGKGLSGHHEALLGDLMLLANCLSYSLYLVLSKPSMRALSATTVITQLFLFATVLMLPFSLPSLLRLEPATIPPLAWISLGSVIIGPTVIAYLLNAWALARVDSSLVAIYTYVQPFLASLLAVLFLGERIRGMIAVAAVMIFGGVYVASRSPAISVDATIQTGQV